MRILATVVVAIAGLGAGLAADDWPQWRGPSLNGVSGETNLPVEWHEGRNVRWRAPLEGAGVSSPVVWGDRVFVTAQAGAGVRRQGNHPTLASGRDSGEGMLSGARARDGVAFLVTAFDRATGGRVWQHELAAEGDLPPVHDKHNLASPSPVTDGERVYAWFGTGQLVALTMAGEEVWTRHLGSENAPFVINWGHASSPALHGHLLILPCLHERASYILALDTRTGREVWRSDRPAGVISYSTPVIVEGPSGPEVIVNTSAGVESLDPANGERRWYIEEDNRFPIPVATEAGGMLYLSRGYRSGPYMAVRLGGRGNVTASHMAWHVPTGAPYIPSLVLYDGLLYMGSEGGVISAIDAATGERVWQERIGGVFTSSPVAGDGKVYFVSETGETVVLKAGRTPEVLARNTLDGHFVASPAIAGGLLYLRADDALVAVGEAAGTR
jgi:outer membrane protein assembly factor BamB